MSPKEQSIYVYGPTDEAPEDLGEQFAFSHATCGELNLKNDKDGKDRTVRTYQGSTVKGHALTLRIGVADEPLLQSSELSIVALSRHVDQLNIVHNGSESALAWLDDLGLPNSRSPSSGTALPINSPTHTQAEGTMTDEPELGKIVTDYKESALVTRKLFRIPITTTTILSALGLLVKYIDGTTFVNHELTPFFLIFKTMYLNRVFLSHRLSWTEWTLSLVTNFSKASFIVFTLRTLLYPLRLLFPVLALIFQRHRPGYARMPLTVLPLHILGRRFGLDIARHYNLVSHLATQVASWLPRHLPDSVVDLAAALDVSGFIDLSVLRIGFLGVDVFCDLLEPVACQLLAGLLFAQRLRPQEDVLFDISMPDLRGDLTFHELVNGVQRSESFNGFQDWFMTYIPSTLRKWSTVPSLSDWSLKLAANVSPKDAFLFALDAMPGWSHTSLAAEYPNIYAAAKLPSDYRVGTMDPADFLRPVNARGHPKAAPKAKFNFGAVAGHRFTANQPLQVLHCIGARYFGKKPNVAGREPMLSARIAEDIMSDARRELFKARPDGWDENSLDILATEFLASAEAKHYEAQFTGEDDPNARSIRFHLKSIFKPALSNQKPMDESKAPQGISAWHKNSQIMFGLCAKWINYVFLNSLNDNVFYDNRMSPETFRTKLRSVWDNVDHTAKNGVTDFAQFDAQQDEFSQELEKRTLQLLGVSDEFIDHYYSLRKGQKLYAPGIAGSLSTEKPSGEPLTLWGNSVIGMLLSNYLIRGDGPFIAAYKGDDGFKRQANMRISEERQGLLSQVCRLQIKAYVEDTAEFTGYAIGARSFCPSIPRKLAKIMGHDFNSYAHFCEYRKSISDWLHEYDTQDTEDIIATNSDLFGIPVGEVIAMVEIIRSFSHLGEEQFNEHCSPVGDPEILQDGYGKARL
jgi:hypothetical protein